MLQCTRSLLGRRRRSTLYVKKRTQQPTTMLSLLLFAAAAMTVVPGTRAVVDPVILDLQSVPPPIDTDAAGISVDLAIRTLNSAGGCGDKGGRSRGRSAYRFLTALAASEAFSKDAWRRRPVMIKAADVMATGSGNSKDDTLCSNWASGLFTLEDLLSGVDGTVIPGQRTGDSIRDGTKPDRWEKNGPIAGAASGGGSDSSLQTMSRADVQAALRNGTIFFNHVMLGFPILAALSTLMTESFGLPGNLNVYITPPNMDVSVPPHTDGQDVLVVQTEGKKRWRVFDMPLPINPYDKGKAPPDPFSRGKRGDVLTQSELGEPVLDIVLNEGDILYVPAGFPHATDTKGKEDSNAVFTETSVHLTVGLDTNVWGLSYAHLRSMLLKRSGLASIIGGSVTKFDEEAARDSARPIPIGFLGPKGANGETVGGNVKDLLCHAGKLRREGDGRRNGGGQLQDGVARYVGTFIAELKRSMIRLEPGRWIDGVGGQVTPAGIEQGREGLPTLDRFIEVAEFVLCSHLPAILDAQDAAFTNVKLRDPNYSAKVNYYSKVQRDITTRFTAFVETVPTTPSERKGSSYETSEQKEVKGWDLQEDGVFALLILAAIVVGGPAILDIVKDFVGVIKPKQKKA